MAKTPAKTPKAANQPKPAPSPGAPVVDSSAPNQSADEPTNQPGPAETNLVVHQPGSDAASSTPADGDFGSGTGSDPGAEGTSGTGSDPEGGNPEAGSSADGAGEGTGVQPGEGLLPGTGAQTSLATDNGSQTEEPDTDQEEAPLATNPEFDLETADVDQCEAYLKGLVLELDKTEADEQVNTVLLKIERVGTRINQLRNQMISDIIDAVVNPILDAKGSQVETIESEIEEARSARIRANAQGELNQLKQEAAERVTKAQLEQAPAQPDRREE